MPGGTLPETVAGGVSLSYFYFAQPVLALNAYRVQALFEMLEIQQ